MSGEPLSGESLRSGPVTGDSVPGKASRELRAGHFLRIGSYLDYAILSMWAGRRPQVVMGMAEASVRGYGPGGAGGPDEEILIRLRGLIGEAREYHAAGDFPAAMARMRVAEDLVALYTLRICGE
jgi:hypothetical protein